MNVFYREKGGRWTFLCCCKEDSVTFWAAKDKKDHCFVEREYTAVRGRFPTADSVVF